MMLVNTHGNQLLILLMPLQKFTSFTNAFHQNQRFSHHDLKNLTSYIYLSWWQASYWTHPALFDHTIKRGETNPTNSYFVNLKNYQRIFSHYGKSETRRGSVQVTRIFFCATCRGNTSTNATINFTTTPLRRRATHTKYTTTYWTFMMLGNSIGRRTSNG